MFVAWDNWDNAVARIVMSMRKLLDPQLQNRGCEALKDIAAKSLNGSMAVASLGGCHAVLRAMWAYPGSAGIQGAGVHALRQVAERYTLEGLLEPVMWCVREMGSVPWGVETQTLVREILARTPEEGAPPVFGLTDQGVARAAEEK